MKPETQDKSTAFTKEQAIELWFKRIADPRTRKYTMGYGPGGYMQFILTDPGMKLTLITYGLYIPEEFVQPITESSLKRLITPYGQFELTVGEATQLRDSWRYQCRDVAGEKELPDQNNIPDDWYQKIETIKCIIDDALHHYERYWKGEGIDFMTEVLRHTTPVLSGISHEIELVVRIGNGPRMTVYKRTWFRDRESLSYTEFETEYRQWRLLLTEMVTGGFASAYQTTVQLHRDKKLAYGQYSDAFGKYPLMPAEAPNKMKRSAAEVHNQHSANTPVSGSATKPPLGLMPKKLHYERLTAERFNEVCGAIVRYYNAGLKINVEWIEEYNELVSEIINQPNKEVKALGLQIPV